MLVPDTVSDSVSDLPLQRERSSVAATLNWLSALNMSEFHQDSVKRSISSNTTE